VERPNREPNASGSIEQRERLERTLIELTQTLDACEGLSRREQSVVSPWVAPLLQAARRAAEEAVDQLSSGDQLPLTVALMGGTNTGKSATLNLLAGREVTKEKVTANATKRLLIFAHEDWLEALMSPARPWPEPQLSDDSEAPLQSGSSARPLLSLHREEALRELILIDCPDLDSTETGNAHQAIDMNRWADRALFLATPQKYKDELLVNALKGLLAQGKRVHVLFNMLTPRHRAEEMLSDLEATLEMSDRARALLSFERPLMRRPRSEASDAYSLDEAGLEAQRALRLSLLSGDHRAERGALLEARLSGLMSALSYVEEAIERSAALLKERRSALLELSVEAPAARRGERAEGGAQGESERVALALRTLSLSATLSRAEQQSAQSEGGGPQASPSAPLLKASLAALSQLAKLGHERLTELIYHDALIRAGLSPQSALGEDATQAGLITEVLKAAQELIDERSKARGEAVFQLPGELSSSLDTPDHTTALEALAVEGARLDEEGLSRALDRELVESLRAVVSDQAWVKSLERARPRALEPLQLSAPERGLLIGIKALCALTLVYLTMGVGLWDFFWAPLGFELGAYPVAILLLRLTRGRDSSGERGRDLNSDPRAQAVISALIEAPLRALGGRAGWPSAELEAELKRLKRLVATLRGTR